MCNGARGHACWQSATIDGPLAAERVVQGEARRLDAEHERRIAEQEAAVRKLEAAQGRLPLTIEQNSLHSFMSRFTLVPARQTPSGPGCSSKATPASAARTGSSPSAARRGTA